jgi:large subunit ribosomal protein L10
VAVTNVKKAVVSDLKDKLVATKGAVLVNYRGLTVAQDTKLRRKFREAGVDYFVAKNTMIRLAAEQAGIEGLEPFLEGPSAIALSVTDPVMAAKVMSEFLKDIKTISIKSGILEGNVIDEAGVKALANLPSREVLLSRVFAGMQSPIGGLVNVLQGSIRNVVYALDAIRQQKESA